MNVERLPAKWQWRTLADIAANVPNAIVDGPFGSSLKTSDYVEDGVPVLQGKNISENRFRWTDIRYISEAKARELKRSSLRPGDILMIKIGSIGYSALVPELNGHPFAVIPANLAKVTLDHSKADTSYLLHWLQSVSSIRYLQGVASKTAQPALSLSKIKALPVPLPRLEEQRRIAAILDQADALRTKRRQALAKLDTLTQSLFLEMFSRNGANECLGDLVELQHLCASADDIRCGPFGTQLLSSEFVLSGIPLWGIKQTNSGFSRLTSEFLTSSKADSLNNYTIRHGDIVMTRKGTIGNCAVFPSDRREGIMHSDLLRIRVDQERCNPIFLAHQLHNSSDVGRQLSLISGGAIMPGINVSKLKKLVVFVPSLTTQEDFAKKASEIAQARKRIVASATVLETLFASLQHRAFRGEL